MTANEKKEEGFSAVIADVDQRLRSGEVDRSFGSSEAPTRDTVTKLHRAEELDPQTLKLTVTI